MASEQRLSRIAEIDSPVYAQGNPTSRCSGWGRHEGFRAVKPFQPNPLLNFIVPLESVRERRRSGHG
jgi:hypothetical protein